MTDDDSTDESFSEPNNPIHDHCNYMVVRENMKEFPGRVPHRKRKKGSENPEQDSSKPKVRTEEDFPFDFKPERRREAKVIPSMKINLLERERRRTFTTLTLSSLLIYFVIIIIEKTNFFPLDSQSNDLVVPVKVTRFQWLSSHISLHSLSQCTSHWDIRYELCFTTNYC